MAAPIYISKGKIFSLPRPVFPETNEGVRNAVRPGQVEVTLIIAAAHSPYHFCCPARQSSEIDSPASCQTCESLMAFQKFAGRVGWLLVIGYQVTLSNNHTEKLPGPQSPAGGEGMSFGDETQWLTGLSCHNAQS